MPPLLLALSLLACSEDSTLPAGAATFEPGPTCAWTRTAVGGDDDPGLGLSVAAHLAELQDEVLTTLKWDQSDETTALTTAFSAESAEWVTGELVDAETGEPVDPETLDTGIDPDAACPPYLAVAGSLSLSTEDGRLAELLAVEAHSDLAGVARIDTKVALEDIAGGELPLGIDADDWDTVVIDVAVNLAAGVSQGELAVHAERVNNTEDIGHSDDIARWPWEE